MTTDVLVDKWYLQLCTVPYNKYTPPRKTDGSINQLKKEKNDSLPSKDDTNVYYKKHKTTAG